MIEEDTMNPMCNWAIAAERIQSLRAEAGSAARARRLRHQRRLALTAAVPGRGRSRVTARGIGMKAREAL
jgi:hypothetical protein